ncbi:uncharacterized protein TNCT_394231 [Trichonephila clavata]|uniref:Uncharacterized protein n=1 Tax=Trichonephila clavata TaxID=2740835 RepID=A0A8X6HTT7_TRICU|nr:uncharacterized protein TNCT_394231 [Trichonephila clavata]
MATRAGIGKYTKHNPPRLKDVAAIKVAIELCMKSEMRAFITKYLDDYNTDGKRKEPDWKLIRYKSVKQIFSFPVSKNDIRIRILSYVPRLFRSIFEWIDFHSVNTYLKIEIPEYFMWTVFGTVDKKRTAEVIISSSSTNIVNKYKLACIYCLEKAATELWIKLDSTEKNTLINVKNPAEVKQEGLVTYWTYSINKSSINITDESALDLISAETAFINAAVTGNLVAVEYFFQLFKEPDPNLLKLALQNICWKRKWISNFYKDEYEGFTSFPVDDLFKVFYYILSRMRISDQNVIIPAHPLEVMRCFLMSPRQKYFIKLFKLYYKLIPKYRFAVLFRDIFFKDLKTFTQFEHSRLFFTSAHEPVEDYIQLPYPMRRYNYRRLFAAVWRRLPIELKLIVGVRTDCGSDLLFNLLFKYDLGCDITDEFIEQQTRFLQCFLNKQTTTGRIIYNDSRMDLLRFLLQKKIANYKSMACFQTFRSRLEEYEKEKDNLEPKFKLVFSIISSFAKIEENGFKKLKEIAYFLPPDERDESSVSDEENDDVPTKEKKMKLNKLQTQVKWK